VVSARVAALEDLLGLRLLERATRKLALTPDRLSLYQQCANLVSAADHAAATLTESSLGLKIFGSGDGF
jgi:DNA-binding transcriptional LysR family regulator